MTSAKQCGLVVLRLVARNTPTILCFLAALLFLPHSPGIAAFLVVVGALCIDVYDEEDRKSDN